MCKLSMSFPQRLTNSRANYLYHFKQQLLMSFFRNAYSPAKIQTTIRTSFTNCILKTVGYNVNVARIKLKGQQVNI